MIPAIKPRLVAKSPRPQLRQVTLDDAAAAHPYSAALQQRWLASIHYLRTRSRCGWVLDRGSKPKFHNHD